VASLILKQLSQKDHIDLFSELLQDPPQDIQSILEGTLVHFGQTHTVQDIKDLNSLLSWVLYSTRGLSLAELNAAIGLESQHGEFLDIRDKIEREFSAYFSIVDPHLPQGTVLLRSDNPISQENKDNTQLSIDNDVTTLDDLDDGMIKIGHGSISKFFRSAQKSIIKEKGVEIGVNSGEANLKLAKSCLRAICLTEEPLKTWKSPMTKDKLLSYAITSLSAHLRGGRSAANLEDKLEIWRNLTKMLRDENIISRWVKMIELWPSWFALSSNSDLGVVWAWLSDETILKELGEDEKAWITEPASSIAERLLKPVAVWHAKCLLQDADGFLHGEHLYFFIFMHALINLVSFRIRLSLVPFNIGKRRDIC